MPLLSLVSQGHYYQDHKHGRGQYTWADGRIYEGEFYLDVVQGYGRITSPNGRVYEGEWYQGMMHGQGEFIFTLKSYLSDN